MISARSREKTGSRHCRRMRREGYIPVVIYGHGTHTNAAVNLHDFLTVMHHTKSEHAIAQLQVDDVVHDVLIKDIQRDAVKHDIVHVDFLRVAMDEVVTITVPIVTEGDPEGVRNQGGVMEILRREVELECQARNIPDTLTVDVSTLGIHDTISVADLPAIEGVTYKDPEDTLLVTIAPPTLYTEAEPTDELEPEEPEVIGAKDEQKEGEE